MTTVPAESLFTTPALELCSYFESGNLSHYQRVAENEYDLYLRPDTNNERYRVWFYFCIHSSTIPCSGSTHPPRSGKKSARKASADVQPSPKQNRVLLHIVNFSKFYKRLFRKGASPVIRSNKRPDWNKIPCQSVYHYKSPRHQGAYVLTIALSLDDPLDTYYLAYSYPYTYSDLQEYISHVQTQYSFCCKHQIVTQTYEGRNVDLLTITSPSTNCPNGESKKIVFMTARVHPGETPASWVCKGIIDFLISDEPEAVQLRQHLVFKVIPMLNPDGVVHGNYRCSVNGFDLNRFWEAPDPILHPSIHATKSLLQSLDENGPNELDFYIDIHAHSSMVNGFLYGNLPSDRAQFEAHDKFPRMLDRRIPDFSLAATEYNNDSVKAGTGRRSLAKHLVKSYTFEVSLFCQHDEQNGTVPYTLGKYEDLGRNFALTFLDYYDLNVQS